MGKRSGGTRNTNSFNSDKSRTLPSVSAQPLEHGAYNDMQHFLDGLPDYDELDIFTSSLEYEAPIRLKRGASAIATYVEDANLTSPENKKIIGEIARQSPKVFENLHRGINIESDSEAKKFVSSLQKGKETSLASFGKSKDIVSFSTAKDTQFTYNYGFGHQFNIKLSGKTRGLDLSKAGETEVVVSANTKVKIKNIINKNGVTEIYLERI